jgi:hypothetical protein
MSVKKTASAETNKPTPSINSAINNPAIGKKNNAAVIGRLKNAVITNNGIDANARFTNPVPIAEKANTVFGI